MPVVPLVIELVAGHGDLFGVDHDHEVAGVDVRSAGRLALAPQRVGDLRRQPAEGSPGSIDEKPVPLSIRWGSYVGLHGMNKPRGTRAAADHDRGIRAVREPHT